jgi:hypothetical protein
MTSRSKIWGLLVLALAALAACSNPTGSSGTAPSTAYKNYLYLTDSSSGHVGAWNPSTHAMVTSSLVTTAGSAGEIRFYKGIGYVAVAPLSGDKGGVYWFDPSSSSPSAQRIVGSEGIGAQYFAFLSASKAYFSAVNGNVYSFDPSQLAAGAVSLASTSGAYLQDIALGADGRLYAAELYSQAVVRIDPATKSITKTFATSAGGTTGLFLGTYKGKSGIFVANTGGYDSNYAPLAGSIDFIDLTDDTVSTITNVLSASGAIYPGRLVQLSNGNLIASGYGHTYLVDLSGSTPSTTEVLSGSTAFGNLSLALKDGTVYVPTSDFGTTANNQLFAFDASGAKVTSSPFSVLTSTDWVSNAAFYEE